MQALLPLAQARMALPREATPWADVCSSAGARGVRAPGVVPPGVLAAPDAPDTPGTATGHARCWACLLLAQAAVAPPPASALLRPVRTPVGTTPTRLAGAEPRPTRSPAAPRAPPRQS